LEPQYTRTAMLLHWLIAVLLLGQFLFGWYLTGIPRGIPERGYFVNLHKSTGLVIGVLVLLRIAWRLSHTPPPLPQTVPGWQRTAARVSHVLLYVLMLAMPLSGYIASNFSKWGVKIFNTFTLPPWGSDDKQIYAFFNQAHQILSWALLGLILLHVLAALKHALLDRDEILFRMAPLGRSNRHTGETGNTNRRHEP
jgi:cytochrome b561